MLSLISLIMYFAFGWRHLAGSFSSRVLWNKAVTQQDFLTGVRLYLMAAESGKEITEPWFQKYKLGNGIALFICQHIGTELEEIVICEGKCSIEVNLICILIYFPCLLKEQYGQSHCCTTDLHRSSWCTSSLFCQGHFSSSCKHNILPCRCQCWLSGPAPFCFPAAPTPDCAPSPAVAWLTHFLLHFLPNACWTPFPNPGPAHLCDWLLSLLQWQHVQRLLFENLTAIHLWNCGAGD